MTFLKNNYLNLGSQFFSNVTVASFPNSELYLFNSELSDFLNLNLSNETESHLAKIFSGQILIGPQPIALKYCGHQFGQLNPQLGDGRAHFLGDCIAKDNKLYDLQLKGSGPTPYSRQGDGLSALGPCLREYLISEAMYHLKVPTTRSLAVVKTNEKVLREEVLDGGIVTRVANSHLRFGTFEYYAVRNQKESLQKLLNYAIQRHFPDLESTENKPIQFFKAVGNKIIELVGEWMRIGFIHGVMNTDNMTISGDTIDYGPCAFMDYYHPEQWFSSIDRNGRYRFNNQPGIALWNLSILAQCLVPLIDDNTEASVEKMQFELNELKKLMESKIEKIYLDKIGLQLSPQDSTEEKNIKIQLSQDYLKYLQDNKIDYTFGFSQISKWVDSSHLIPKELSSWYLQIEPYWNQSLNLKENLKSLNPQIIPYNLIIETLIQEGLEGNLENIHLYLKDIKNPYEEKNLLCPHWKMRHQVDKQFKTFCGT